MSLILALVADVTAFVVIWRSIKLITKPQQKMFETESDYMLRKAAGYFLILLGVVAVVANHTIFKF